MSYFTGKVHITTADLSTVANEYTKASVEALAGHQVITLALTAVHETPEGAAGIQYASGAIQSSRIARRTYLLETEPFTFLSQRTKGTTEMYQMMQAPFLWLEINTLAQDANVNVGNTDPYHTASYVIPVTLDGFNLEHLDDSGQKRVSLTFKHRYYNQ
jgi:hypothetical protein